MLSLGLGLWSSRPGADATVLPVTASVVVDLLVRPAYLWQDAAGTTPVTADGDPVGLWLDRSANAYTFRQTTAGNRPTYRTDGTLHWLEFSGTDHLTSLASNLATVQTISLTASMTVYQALSRPTASSGSAIGLAGSPSVYTYPL